MRITLLPLLVFLLVGIIPPAVSAQESPEPTGEGSSAVGDADHSAGVEELAPLEAPPAPVAHSEAGLLLGLERAGDALLLPLFDFEEEGDLARFVYGQVNTFVERASQANDGDQVASMTYYRNPEPSGKAAYFHVLFTPDRGRVTDWRPFTHLEALLFNTEQFPVTLNIILNDDHDVRAQQIVTLQPQQWFEWRWTLARAANQGLDLGEIKRLSFKQIDTQMTDINTVLIDRVRLRGTDQPAIIAMLEAGAPYWVKEAPISHEPKADFIPRIDFSEEARADVERLYGLPVDGVITTQVCVVGGGMAGASAAVGASHAGAKTVLIEGNGFLGGMGTAAMVYPWMPSMAGGEQIIEGVFMDLYARLVAQGHASRAPGNASIINFDKEALKFALQEEVIASGSEMLLHTWVGDALMDGTTIRGVVGYNKSGTIAVLADRVVDCTGDGDVAMAAGAAFEQGRGFDIYGQAVTLFFRMGNVDYPTAFSEQNRRLTRYDQQIPAEYLFNDLFKAGKASGELDADLPISTIYFEKTLSPGVVSINASRVFEIDTTNVLDLTFAEIEARRQVDQLSKFLIKRIPGFKSAFLQETATQIGVRESRRVVGEYMLTGEDVIHATKFPDVIARGSFGIDIHCADYTGCGIAGLDLVDGASYDIPYRSLVPETIDNLLIGGRCISVTHIALGSTRIQPVASATGQAAGCAAAISLRLKVTPRDLPYADLRRELLAQKVNLGNAPLPLVATPSSPPVPGDPHSAGATAE